MQEPSLRTSRLIIAAGFTAAIAVGATGFYLGRSTAPKSTIVRAEPPQIIPKVAEIEPQRALTRADIVEMADSAADALASGKAPAGNPDDLIGRRMELTIPFGCDGPASETSTAPLRWRYDAEEQTIRIHAFPVTWTGKDWHMEAPSDGNEQFEGFWISRPWSSAEQCPKPSGQATATDGQAILLPGQTLAIAEGVTSDPRRETQGSPRRFEITQRMPPEKFDGTRGFRLRLIGRIARSSDGRAVRCIQPAGIEQRPICLVNATFDEIRIENPVDDKALGIWTSGSTRSAAF